MSWFDLMPIELVAYQPAYFDTIVTIEQDAMDAWPARGITNILRHTKTLCLIARSMERRTAREVVGYMLYYVHQTKYEILRLGVARQHRERHVGLQMMNYLKGRCQTMGRSKVEAWAREHNLVAQLFLRGCLFRAVRRVPDYELDPSHDLYVFRYRNDQPIIKIATVPRFSHGDFFQKPLAL
jgi:ribosomal protein S18 acetylase RimI-like enzyme